jgi:hypothetical protein
MGVLEQYHGGRLADHGMIEDSTCCGNRLIRDSGESYEFSCKKATGVDTVSGGSCFLFLSTTDSTPSTIDIRATNNSRISLKEIRSAGDYNSCAKSSKDVLECVEHGRRVRKTRRPAMQARPCVDFLADLGICIAASILGLESKCIDLMWNCGPVGPSMR